MKNLKNLRHNLNAWVYWTIQFIVVIVCVTVLGGCIPQVNPWNAAHSQCSKLSGEIQQAQCHLSISIARDACNAGVDKVECSEGVNMSVCTTINNLLYQLCDNESTPLEHI